MKHGTSKTGDPKNFGPFEFLPGKNFKSVGLTGESISKKKAGSGREILKKSIKKIAKIAKTTFCPEKLHMKQKTPFYARKLF